MTAASLLTLHASLDSSQRSLTTRRQCVAGDPKLCPGPAGAQSLLLQQTRLVHAHACRAYEELAGVFLAARLEPSARHVRDQALRYLGCSPGAFDG